MHTHTHKNPQNIFRAELNRHVIKKIDGWKHTHGWTVKCRYQVSVSTVLFLKKNEQVLLEDGTIMEPHSLLAGMSIVSAAMKNRNCRFFKVVLLY